VHVEQPTALPVDAPAAADEVMAAPAPPPTPLAPRRRWLSWLLRIVGGLFAVLLVGVGLVVHNAVYLVNQNLDRLTAMASEHFERKLTVASVHGRVFPRVAVVIDGLELASREPGKPALLLLPSIEVRFRTDRAILSLGKELITESVRVERGVVHIRRDFDGEVDMLDVVKRLPPLDPKDIQGAVLEEVVINDVDIEYVDEPAMQVVALHDFHLETKNAALGVPFNALLTAVWAGPESPLSVKVHVDEVPRDLQLWPFPVSTIDVAVDDVGITDAIATFGLPPAFDDGAVDLRVGIVNSADHHAHVTVTVDGEGTSMAVLTGTGAGIEKTGVKGPITVLAVVDHDVDAGATVIETASVSMAGIALDAKARLDGAGVHELDAMIDVEQLARLGMFVPALLGTAPGAFTIAGHAKGYFGVVEERFEGDFDFGRARVEIGEALQKQPGETLGLKLRGRRQVDDTTTADCGLFRTSLNFALPRGTRIDGFLLVPAGEGDDVILDLASNRIELGEASSISPLLNDLFGKEQPGQLQAHAKGRISSARTAFDIDLQLTNLGLVYDRTTAVGTAMLHFDIDVDKNGLALGLRGDATNVALTTKDEEGNVLFEKANTESIVLTAALRELGGRGSLGKAMEGMDGNGAIVDGDGLAPRWRAILGGLQGKAAVTASKFTLAKIPVTDVQLALELQKGQLRIKNGGLALFGGQVTMGETVAALTTSPAKWGLAVKASGLSAKQLLAPIERFTGEVTGAIDIETRLAAEGMSINGLLQSLDGPLTFSTHGVHLATLDIISSWVDNVWDFIGRIPGVDPKEIAIAKSQGIGSTIADGSWTMRFKRDQFLLDEPMVVETTFGVLRVEGSAGFDGSINFDAHLGLINDQLREMRIVSDDKPLALRVGVTGTWSAPVFTSDNLEVLRTALQDRAREAIDGAVKSVQDNAQTLQDRVNVEVDRAQRSVEQTFGKSVAGSSRSGVGLATDDGTSAIGDADIGVTPVVPEAAPTTPAPAAPTTTTTSKKAAKKSTSTKTPSE